MKKIITIITILVITLMVGCGNTYSTFEDYSKTKQGQDRFRDLSKAIENEYVTEVMADGNTMIYLLQYKDKIPSDKMGGEMQKLNEMFSEDNYVMPMLEIIEDDCGIKGIDLVVSVTDADGTELFNRNFERGK